ncbi:Major facilitator superfamily domain general substrate transporter [Penicillium cf. griseofulvum]|uniref:Major facilitator superfamily domain general substrate transporter n=1 Tax=Penicillium cf. griseofulvum TaxID=2972120 RepID=A0A9W9JTC2_9EURO|nr:Major facilitator superfamily domain general substrate transporter [Penicillium cf. griseofulvum]KAJ5423853.1 Major facilitator superfamily domain general substrate transporter [Penicillium cf. griseofulvum]KAJ5430893.1 Major facilitator superfamily domain general substrate transporter [Penicillium cf. griseofulvum]
MGRIQPDVVAQPSDDLDDAVMYLNNHGDVAPDSQVNLRALRRKIDRRLMPYMFCCYVLQFLDKVMLNYAAVMGIKKDLALARNDFSNVATWFFIAYLIAEIPNVYCLQKVPPAKWLGGNVFLWGVAAAASAGAQGYRSLLAARVFLGIFEATVGPSLMLISSQYYTRSEQAPRFTIWYMGLGAAQIIGGIISFGFQQVNNASLEGWRIMFLVLGLVTVVVGGLTFFFLPDTPMNAPWLSDNEKVALLQHVSENQTGVWSTTLNLKQIWEAVLDIQMWLLVLITILISVSSGVVTTYSSTLIAGFGFSGPISALLNTPSGVVSIFFTLLVGFGIRTTSNRWAWNVLCTIPGIIGAALLSFLPKSNKAGVLIGIYLVNAIVATLPILYQWTMANCAGHTKRAFASALVAGSFSVGNIIGPQTFQSHDAPEYKPAKIAVLATQAAAAALSIVLFVYYKWQNRRRDQTRDRIDDNTANENKWAGLTDKENPSFRYVY